MDRPRNSHAACRARVPRMRGDGPMPTTSLICPSKCSPHARGWTARHGNMLLSRAVFPACAGMDRCVERPSGLMPCVPRMRGDGPNRIPNCQRFHRCSPHARGWTAGVLVCASEGRVFPACAGMDRGRSGVCIGGAGVPRMRGDGPSRVSIKPMHRECSPHARGWTGPSRTQGRGHTVFPACAGMDRIRPGRLDST